MTHTLAFRPSSKFAAGADFRTSPRISYDGKALHLEASQFDRVDKFILDSDAVSRLKFNGLKQLLSKIKDLETNYLQSKRSTFSALSCVMVSAPKQDTPEFIAKASKWLCYTLTSMVIETLYKNRMSEIVKRPRRYEHPELTSDGFSDWLSRQPGEKQNDLDDLLKLYEEVKAKYPNEPWPEVTPRSVDLMLHSWVLSQIASMANALDKSDGSSSIYKLYTNRTLENLEGTLKNFVVAHRMLPSGHRLYEKDPPSGLYTTQSLENLNETLQKFTKSQSIFVPDDPELHNQLDDASHAVLTWRKVFITKRGYIGIGPKWINEDDTIMIVNGAPVPFVFTKLEADLRREEIEIRKTIDKNLDDYNYTIANKNHKKKSIIKPLSILEHKRWDGKIERLAEEYVELKRDLQRVTGEIGKKDGWVLLGEAYVEGIMHGEAAERYPRERIVIY
jgi:hypothetical protein